MEKQGNLRNSKCQVIWIPRIIQKITNRTLQFFREFIIYNQILKATVSIWLYIQLWSQTLWNRKIIVFLDSTL